MTEPLRQRPAGKALERHHAEFARRHLRDLFTEDPGRASRYSLDAAGLRLDYSKNRVTDETMRLLLQLAVERGLGERIAAMFRGDRINVLWAMATTCKRSIARSRPRAERGTSRRSSWSRR
jgi:glucose-6-phosphate isomerase